MAGVSNWWVGSMRTQSGSLSSSREILPPLKLIWKKKFPGKTFSWWCECAGGHGAVVVPIRRKDLLGLDLCTGRKLWEQKGVRDSFYFYSHDWVFAQSGNFLFTINLKTGTTKKEKIVDLLYRPKTVCGNWYVMADDFWNVDSLESRGEFSDLLEELRCTFYSNQENVFHLIGEPGEYVLGARAIADLEIKWQKPIREKYLSILCCSENRVFVYSSDSRGHRISCLDAKTGYIHWELAEYRVDKQFGYEGFPCYISNDIFSCSVVGNSGRKIVGLSVSKGERLWELPPWSNSVMYSSGVATDKVFWRLERSGNLVCRTVQEAEELHRYKFDLSKSAGVVAAIEGKLLLRDSEDGILYCYEHGT